MNRKRVILDTDMVDLFDDGLAMLMLADDPGIDLLAVTVTAGNTSLAEGTASALRQLLLSGNTDIPVAMGASGTSRAKRYEEMEKEKKLLSLGPETFLGSLAYRNPTDWKEVYRKKYGEEPVTEPVETPASDMILSLIHRCPNEVTIAAIGPCGNLAEAFSKDPGAVALVKEIIYMGGAFFVPGNISAAAEFNFWFDPESAQKTVRLPFARQTFVGLDACNQVPLDYSKYLYLKDRFEGTVYQSMFESNFNMREIAANHDMVSYIWDLLVAVILTSPEALISTFDGYVDIEAAFTPDYGRSRCYSEKKSSLQLCSIVMKVEADLFWKKTDLLLGKLKEHKLYSHN